ncbi:PAS domain S-box protein [Pseudodesulfovibrio sp.]|uniref:PAS domain S-box protein n=1 Tax=Pseudodesulfovibrio sp. TaxID=2035812 RepID=UPI002612ABD8|nr:PAS domain S-box protein [Pseudodesulfovibrio sp.]MDD3312066.1 PAS domain S-box protein [Pseudodesulfovibrio sp.]
MTKQQFQLVPLAVALILAAGLVAGLFVDQQNFEQKSRLAALGRLTAVRSGLENALLTRLNVLKALTTYARLKPDLDARSFATLAEGLTAGVDGIRLAALARKNVVSHTFPPEASARWMHRELPADGREAVRALAARVQRTRQLRVAAPLPSPDSAGTILAAAPVFLEGGRGDWGLALLVIDAPTLFREAGLTNPLPDLRIALRVPSPAAGERSELFGPQSVFDQRPVLLPVPAPGGGWQAAAVPAGGWGLSPNRPIILYGGGGAALLVAGLVFATLSQLSGRLRERDEFRRLMAHARSIVLRLNAEGAITYCNEYAETFYGYGPGELTGRPLVGTLVPPGSPAGEALGRRLGRLLENPSAIPFREFLTLRRSGEAVWIAWTHEPVLDASGRLAGILSVGTDITDRKFMEEALRRRERQYRLLAENVTDVIFGLDADLRYTFASPSDEVARGVRRTEVLGRPLADSLKPASRVRFLDTAERLREQPDQGMRSAILDLEFLCADGSTLWLETRLGPMLNDGGQVIGILGVGRDITDRKLAEALREDVERMARHDLKTPLGAVIGLPEEIRRMGGLTPDQDRLLDIVGKAGRDMLRHINSSLSLHKMEQGDYRLELETVDVLAVLEEIRAESLSLIRDKGVSLGIEIAGIEKDRFPARVDPPLFRSLLGNLMRNALIASPDGGTVTVTLAGDKVLSITIRNQGEVPHAIRDTFFGKYVTAGRNSGTGLGTYSARLIARTHGGDILLDASQPGSTGVTVILPR